jgi:nucleoside 2-deoxyribosyltransferase
MKKFVYLAGPILGQTEKQANDWRRNLAHELKMHDIVGVSPLRCEPIHGEVYSLGYPDERFGTARAIMHKNMYDVQTCDAVLAYIPVPSGAGHHSWGTMVELSWAKAFNKLTILVSEDPAVREHPVLAGQAGWIFDNFPDALDVLEGILGGYTGGRNV